MSQRRSLLTQVTGFLVQTLLAAFTTSKPKDQAAGPASQPVPSPRQGTKRPSKTQVDRRAASSAEHTAELAARARLLEGEPSPGQLGRTATFEVEPPAPSALRISYEPNRDAAPDAGEIVWTWIPYEERDGRGKDRPVLVIGRHSASHVYAVRLTSKSHERDRDFLPLGPGPWDSQGRPSWLDIDQLYLVHEQGMRREAAVLDRRRFDTVAQALRGRYGWQRG